MILRISAASRIFNPIDEVRTPLPIHREEKLVLFLILGLSEHNDQNLNMYFTSERLLT